jgi:hypothetical protein
VPSEKFAGERAISFGSTPFRVVFENAFPKAWCFTQTHCARNDGVINALRKMRTNFADDLDAQFRAAVEHGHDNPTDFELIVSA